MAAEPIEDAAPAVAPTGEKVEPKTANRPRLTVLGRTLKHDAESEKRRFYAIAKNHVMQTGRSARKA